MALKGMKRTNALKGNDIIGLMKLFPAFFTKALQKRDGPTARPTDGRTDTHSYRDSRTHLKKTNDASSGDESWCTDRRETNDAS